MKRISYWVVSTISVLVLLFGYHTSTSGAPDATGTSSGFVSSASPGTSSGSTGATGATGSSSSSSSGSSTGAGSSSRSSSSSTVTGSVAQTQWGPVQVRLTVKAGTITKVAVLQYPSGNPKDAEINSYALPILVDETTKAQSAQIDMVSGATVTSTGYLQSLQSALDQAQL